jgi:hypothetical protein
MEKFCANLGEMKGQKKMDVFETLYGVVGEHAMLRPVWLQPLLRRLAVRN